MILRNEYYKAKSLTLGVARNFFVFSIDLFKNLYGGKKLTTIDYPTEKYQYSNRLAGLPQLVLDAKGKSLCTSCDKCVEICPTNCLTVEGTNGQEPKVFDLEVSKCIFCSYCADICPDDAIIMSSQHILSSHAEEDMILKINELKSMGLRKEKSLK